MSSMVSHRILRSVPFALLFSTALASAAQAQSVSVPVVQPLPKSYPGPGALPPDPNSNEGALPPALPSVTPAPIKSLAIPTIGEGSEWDQARARLKLGGATQMAFAISRWKSLSASTSFGFSDYASFILAYPGFPGEEKLRRSAEGALTRASANPSEIAAYFDRNPPLTNAGLAEYALALSSLGRGAQAQALAAWRGGAMSDADETAILALLGSSLTSADHDARMDALLWAGATAQAQRQLYLTSPARRALFAARLAAMSGQEPDQSVLSFSPGGSDPGWLYNRSRQLRAQGNKGTAALLLGNRAPLSSLPLDPDKWVDLQLDAAADTDDVTAVKIASKIDDGFAPGADISKLSFAIRDNYTSLMWQSGLKALWRLKDPRSAAALFWRYGAAARTPQTRSKGFYWAGRAMAMAGDSKTANSYFNAAAAYPDQFYGQLSLERLGRALPMPKAKPPAVPTAAEKAKFLANPLTAAVREVARESDWSTAIRFFKEIADQARTPGEHQLVADLARDLGRRDLGVILGQAAEGEGLFDFQAISFPLIPVPSGTNWTWVHAISRQESQFAMNAVSHAGARGLMQLMPGTAREQAGKVGLSYDPSALMNNAGYNLTLGDAYFQRMLSYFNGSYPLAVAAYNAGPGNVNKWLRNNGDPRTGDLDWIDWIERIPLTETRNYVQRVMENAIVYEAMNPDKARYKGANPLSFYIGKKKPG